MSDQSSAGETQPREDNPEGGATSFRGSDGTAVVVPSTSPGAGERQSRSDTAPAPGGSRDTDDADAERDAEARDNALSVDELKRQLRAARRGARDADRELKTLRDREQARADAEKTELERATERAEAAEARVAALERQNLAQQIAAEAGIPEWADKLDGNDARAMKADAMRIRERLNPGSPGMEGGVRSFGVPPQAGRMDDLIRGAGRR